MSRVFGSENEVTGEQTKFLEGTLRLLKRIRPLGMPKGTYFNAQHAYVHNVQ